MVEAMLLGGLRRCEVLGLRLADIRPGERRLFIAEGKGGHQRIVPVSARFFSSFGSYLSSERPTDAVDDHVFLVLKGARRGQPLSAAGPDEIVSGARTRAGIEHLTCHQLRHTCFTRLREAGTALEAIQAQASDSDIALQWNALMKAAAVTGMRPDRLTDNDFEHAREAILAAYGNRGMPSSGRKCPRSSPGCA